MRFVLSFLLLWSFNLSAQDIYYVNVEPDSNYYTLLHRLNTTNCQDSILTKVNDSNNNMFVSDLAIDTSGSFYVCGFSVFLLTPYIGKLNPITGNLDIVDTMIPFAINSLACSNDNTLFAAGGGGLYSYNLGTGIRKFYGSWLSPSDLPAGDLTFRNGELYCTMSDNRILRVDTNNVANSETLFSYNLPLSISAWGIVSFVYSCDSARTMITTLNSTLQMAPLDDKLYELNIETEELTFLCQLPNRVTGAATFTEYLASDCSTALDLDQDNSSGALGADYRTSNSCAVADSTLLAIADQDVGIRSGYPIDSIVVHLSAPPDGGAEALTGVAPTNWTLNGQNTNRLRLSRTAAAADSLLDDFLRSVRYRHSLPNFSEGTRSINVILYAAGNRTDTAQATLSLALPPQAGRDTAIVRCSNAIPVLLNTLLEPGVSANGTWQPSGVFMPNSNVSGIYRYIVNSSTCGTDTATVQALVSPIATSARTERVCPGATYTFQNTQIPVGTTQNFTLPNPATGCDSTVTISVEALPTATSARTERVCPGATYAFQNTQIPVGTTQNFTLTNPATGCDSTVTITVEALPTATSARTERVCPGATYAFQNTQIPVGTTQNFTLTNPATGCDSTVTITVEVLLVTNTSFDVRVCAGEGYTYGDSTLLPGQTYEFRYLTQQGECDSTVTITVGSWPELTFDLTTNLSCPNVPTGSIEILNLAGGTPPLDFAIQSSDPMWQNDLVFNDLHPGAYTLLVRDANECLWQDSVQIGSLQPLSIALPGMVPLFCDSVSTRLSPSINSDLTGLAFVWNTGATTRDIIVTEAGRYDLRVNNACESVMATTSAEWAQSPQDQSLVYVPNAIAPSSTEEKNTIFKPIFVQNVEVISYRMEVFDRWGNLVFRTLSADDGWQGNTSNSTFADQPAVADTAVYVWWLEATIDWCGRQIALKKQGDVTVIK
jgi:CHU_C Type IX secretion signal domain